MSLFRKISDDFSHEAPSSPLALNVGVQDQSRRRGEPTTLRLRRQLSKLSATLKTYAEWGASLLENYKDQQLNLRFMRNSTTESRILAMKTYLRSALFFVLLPLLAMGIVACTIEEMPELSIDTVSIYATPEANQNSATAVDLVLVYNQELLKTLGTLSAGKYFASSRQLLLDNPTLLDVWHWELVPGQIVENFSPTQDKGDAFGAYVFANYLTPGDHRVKVAPNGVVKILLLRDDLKSLAMFNTHDVNMGKTMSNVSNEQEHSEYQSPCEKKLGLTTDQMPTCQRRAPVSAQQPVAASCVRPSPKKPVQIITRPLNASPKPCLKNIR